MSARLIRDEHNAILIHDVDACPEVEDTRKYSGSLNDAWRMEWYARAKDLFFRWWFVETFVPKEEFQKAQRIDRAVASFFADLERLHYQKHGTRVAIDSRILIGLQMRLLTAQWPTWLSVVMRAKRGQDVLKAQRNLERLVIVGDKWLIG